MDDAFFYCNGKKHRLFINHVPEGSGSGALVETINRGGELW
jgi:hypothetical protein